MNDYRMQPATLKGSKDMKLQDIPVAKATGFGAAADDYMERGIDLNEQLIGNKPATFFFRMRGDAMVGMGITNGDVLIVDRSLKAVDGKIIVASVDGQLLVRRLKQTAAGITLHSGSNLHTSIVIKEGSDYILWGVVTYVIHPFS